MIAGLEVVDHGTISIGEQRIDTLPPGSAVSPWYSRPTPSTRT